MSWVRIGQIGRPHGVWGAVRLQLDNPDTELLRPGLRLQLALGETRQHVTVREVSADLSRVSFDEVSGRDAADALKHAVVYAHRDSFAPLDDDEFYLVDVIGADVFGVDGARLGRVRSFSENTAQPIAEIDADRGLVAVPFVPGIVRAVDVDAGRVVLDPPGGLFDGEPEVAAPPPAPSPGWRKSKRDRDG